MKSWMLRLALGILATASSLSVAEEDRGALRERARTFWEARVQGQWATEYSFLSAREKHKFTVEQYVAHRRKVGPFQYFSARIGEVATAGDIGWVEVTYDVQAKGYSALPVQHQHGWDPWQRRDGQWYPVPSEERDRVPKLPPHLRPAQEEASLGRRIEEFWKAREAGDRKLMYRSMTPEERAKIPEQGFLQSKEQYLHLAHRLQWVEVTGDRGRAMLILTVKPNDPAEARKAPQLGEVTVMDHWVKVDGEWYRKNPEPQPKGGK